MTHSIRDAKRIALDWVDQQEDLPDGRFTLARKYDMRIGGRIFTVMINDPIGKTFLLTEFCVRDEGPVEVLRDRRSYVRQLFAEREIDIDNMPQADVTSDHFLAAVGRFMDATKTQTDATPSWFHGVAEVVKGPNWKGEVNAHADIEVIGSSKLARVPIKIVLSNTAKAFHNKRLPQRLQERKVVMVIHPGIEADRIRSRLYHYLGEIRLKRVYR